MSVEKPERIRKPEWLKIRLSSNEQSAQVGSLLKHNCLHTICSSGRCPNQAECWSRGTATFMILGEICTRNCRFCNTLTGKPLPVVREEAEKLGISVETMALKHAVVTSVTRDDLADQGAEHWANCIRAIAARNPSTKIEVLLPDFRGERSLIEVVLKAKPHIVAHNIETVERLSPEIRSAAKYHTSLQTLSILSESGLPTKSGIMLGLGEREEELFETMDHLRAVGVTCLTMGQYLQPTRKHHPVAAYIHPDKFEEYKQVALEKGFTHVESGPLVRSSYHADKLFD